jgi:hypothetical protein
LAQDDDGNFEIASFGGSLDEEAEEGMASPPAHGQGQENFRPAASKPSGNERQVRHSLDGETIFAVGEDGDTFTEDEDDDEDPKKHNERKGLTS